MITHLDLPDVNLQDLQKHAKEVVRKGRSFGSRENEDTAGLDYQVVTGEPVNLFDECLAEIIPLLPEGQKLLPSIRGKNINILTQGKRYERHVDGNDYTVVIFLNDDFKGGELSIYGIDYIPEKGKAIIFKAGEYEHEVKRVTKGTRYTLIYGFSEGEEQHNELIEKLY